MQQKEEGTGNQAGSNPTQQSNNHMAINPNPRANENTEATSFDKNTADDETLDVGSEITDGEAS